MGTRGIRKRSFLLFRLGAGLFLASGLAFVAEFVGEVTGYFLFSDSWFVHELIQLATLFGFTVGVALIWQSNRLLTQRNQEVERHLKAAQGEFYSMVQLLFDRWGLSEAERDVALFTIKGLSVAEIAELRNTSPGTVKSQNNSIYRKAGVKSRTQLLGALIDELLIVD